MTTSTNSDPQDIQDSLLASLLAALFGLIDALYPAVITLQSGPRP